VTLAVAAWIMSLVGPVWSQSFSPNRLLLHQATPPSADPVRALTLDQAIAIALEQNFSIRAERINPLIQDEHVAMARSAFLPTLASEFSYDRGTAPPDSLLSGTVDTLRSRTVLGLAGVEQLLPWRGASYSFGWDTSRWTSNSVFPNFNPRLGANLRFAFVQPLLKDGATDAQRTQLRVSTRNREISDDALHTAVVQAIRAVKSAYWDLKATIANVDVQHQSLELARLVLHENRARVAAGVMAPLDIVEAEAEVARNEEAVIIAESTAQDAEDRLRALVLDPSTPDFWRVALHPVDSPALDVVPIDIEAAVRRALERRTDLRSAQKGLTNVDDQTTFYGNQRLPRLDLQVQYLATGLGGTQFIRGGGFPGPIVGETTRPIRLVFGDVLRAEYPTWNLGLWFSYPLGRSEFDASHARSRLQHEQGRLQIAELRLRIAMEVRAIGRQVTTTARRIEVARASRLLSEQRLEAEHMKLRVGLSTSFFVIQAQRDLATARVNELRAVLEYNKRLADFEAVQEAPLTGAGIVIGGGGAFAATAPGATIVTSTLQDQQ
jgi:outer membrane protein TolC